jgi:diguanylate cyclase (GGDEF)-like protein
LLFRLYRHTLSAVRHDIHSLIRMFRDLREGSVRVGYPMALREFSEIFDYLRDRGQKLMKEKEKLKDMGLMDHLSQLGNRRHFEARLKELFDASKANGPSSVLIIDMDYFKQVNDKHGHEAGDALIVGFANALRKVVRQTDVLARLGGDEFCIIYTYASLDKAKALAERLRKQLPREISLPKGVIHQLRWTGGLSAMHDKDAKPDDVLWRADQALFQAKEAGRNLTKVYDPVAGLPAKKQIMSS